MEQYKAERLTYISLGIVCVMTHLMLCELHLYFVRVICNFKVRVQRFLWLFQPFHKFVPGFMELKESQICMDFKIRLFMRQSKSQPRLANFDKIWCEFSPWSLKQNWSSHVPTVFILSSPSKLTIFNLHDVHTSYVPVRDILVTSVNVLVIWIPTVLVTDSKYRNSNRAQLLLIEDHGSKSLGKTSLWVTV